MKDKLKSFLNASWLLQESKRRSITSFITLGASTVTATFTVGLFDHSWISPNLAMKGIKMKKLTEFVVHGEEKNIHKK